MNLINGQAIAAKIQEEIKKTVSSITGRSPCLVVILVGENTASEIYIKRKQKACAEVGIDSRLLHLPKETTEKELLAHIDIYNNDSAIDGILVQLPLPNQIRPQHITQAINPAKDVDGFHPINAGKLLLGEQDGFIPCTPLGIKVLLERSNIQVSGKHVVILGRSNIVGKPMAALLMQNAAGANATVTLAHSQTKNLVALCQSADILIAAIGKPRFVTDDMIKQDAVVIDVGINKIENLEKASGYQLVGDVDFELVKSKCSSITPVPGGVGPLTIAMLLQNTLMSYMRRNDL